MDVRQAGNRSLVNEANTQAYLFNLAQSGACAPGVPAVSDIFGDGVGSTYIVMDDIAFPSFRSWIAEKHLSKAECSIRYATAIEKIASTVRLLLDCPLPDGDGIGPIGGGCIQHSFFGMQEAAVPFVNSSALENFVNKVRFYCLQLHAFLGWFVVTGIDSSPRGGKRPS